VTIERPRWAGVDVGAKKKGFHVAVIDDKGLVAGPVRITDLSLVIACLLRERPQFVAVDSPCRAALDGELSRQGERDFAKAGVCGIRYTPNEEVLADNGVYYAWIANGFALYKLLKEEQGAGLRAIECSPTATWSRIGRLRGGTSRARWSREVLDGVRLQRLPLRMNQDARDAIGAALTAKLYAEGKTESFGDIIVPLRRWLIHGTAIAVCNSAVRDAHPARELSHLL
jgi:predicted nuclease with RNAse H fold